MIPVDFTMPIIQVGIANSIDEIQAQAVELIYRLLDLHHQAQ